MAESVIVRLEAALESAMSLELGPRGLLVFEDYAKGNTSGAHLTQRKGIPGRLFFFLFLSAPDSFGNLCVCHAHTCSKTTT